MAPGRKKTRVTKRPPQMPDLPHMTVDSLKRRLRTYSLSTAGLKQTLVNRLTAHLDSQRTRSSGERAGERSDRQRDHSPGQHRAGQRLRSAQQLSHSGEHRDSRPGDHQHDGSPAEHSDSQSRNPRDNRHNRPESRQRDQSNNNHRSRHRTRHARPNERQRELPPNPRENHRERNHSNSRQSLTSSTRRRLSTSHSHRRSRSGSSNSSYLSRSRERSRSPICREHHRRHARRRARRQRRPSTTGSSSGSSSDRSSSSRSTSCSSSNTDSRRRRHRRARRKRTSSTKQNNLVACGPPLSEKLTKKIKKGEYVPFDKLLLPPGHPYPPDHKPRRKQPKRVVNSCSSWLEAWNRYAIVRIAAKPKIALQMVQYQTLMCMAFQKYPVEACVEYDRCFRLQASEDKQILWDKYKEDVFVWCFSPKPTTGNPQGPHASAGEPRDSFRHKTILSRLGPAAEYVTHTAAGDEICLRFNLPRGCTKPPATCKYKHICNRTNCGGNHPSCKCPRKTRST